MKFQPWTEVIVTTAAGTIRGMITSCHDGGDDGPKYWISPLRHIGGVVARPNGRFAMEKDIRLADTQER